MLCLKCHVRHAYKLSSYLSMTSPTPHLGNTLADGRGFFKLLCPIGVNIVIHRHSTSLFPTVVDRGKPGALQGICQENSAPYVGNSTIQFDKSSPLTSYAPSEGWGLSLMAWIRNL